MKSAMVDWSSLPSDLIRCVADCLLATNDIDYYIDMPSVSCSFRTVMADPCRCGTDADLLLFHPRQWIMLDEESEHEDRLFVNVSTGRFLRQRLPLLREHVMIDTSDGLIILGESKHPHAARVLNPLTGSMIDFAMPIPDEYIMISAITGSDPILLFYAYSDDDALWCADRTSKTFSVVPFRSAPFDIQSMVVYAGHAYVADMPGSLFKIVGTAQHCYCKLIAKVSNASQIFLVGSAGELLLVPVPYITYRLEFEIFRVDVERNMLEAVKSIGSRALFVGPRSLSVDANKFPSIHANCLYLQANLGLNPGIYIYDLKDCREFRIAETMVSGINRKSSSVRPMSLVHVILEHCLSVLGVQAKMRHP